MVELHDDGDIIKGLGFVALHSAYQEGVIDECAEALTEIDQKPPAKLHNWSAKRRAEYCIKQLKHLKGTGLSDEIKELIDLLKVSQALLDKRHDVIHGRIYAKFGGPDNHKQGRPDKTKKEITAAELYALANEFTENWGDLKQGSMFGIDQAIHEWRKHNSK
jgi:hypothetical protein